MIKNCLFLLLFLGFMLTRATVIRAADEYCGGEALCPALPGECINGGPWPIGTQITVTYTETFCHCLMSNASCTKAQGDDNELCNVYDENDTYAVELIPQDVCTCYEPGIETTYCDVTWWTSCCTPGEPETGTPTPTGGTPTSTPTNTTSYINGSIQLDESANSSGAFCAQETPSALDLSGLQISLTNPSSPSTVYPISVQNNQFSFNTTTAGGSYTLTLDLSGQVGTNYVCSCPAATSLSNPYLCQYTGVTSPNYNVNFYLKEYSLSNESWFQVFGGNYFGQNGIASDVPYTFCATDGNCQAALSVPIAGSSNPNSSGFPIVSAASSTSVQSTDTEGYTHAYLNLATRTSNTNAYAVNTDINPFSYTYFHKLVENNLQSIGTGEDLAPSLASWTSAAWWKADDVNYVKTNGNLTIDETQGFDLSSTQQLVVFVDGNLTLDDSNVGDTNRQITSVAVGGFLAFFVSGDITITADVGYELNPSAPSVPAVSNSNSNVEGVFVANNNLIIQSKTAAGGTLPDKKFIGAGTFVGWGNIQLNRSFDDGALGPILNNNQAVENFIYRPDLLVNWPTKLKASTSNWREVDPQFINQ